MVYPNLDACRIQDKKGVYLVGGLSRRVNVSSQQSRAFSAVLELDQLLQEDGKSLAGSRVAIIGAGACGLTAAATAGYLGAQVRIFDKNPKFGGAHKASQHRYLHPNFNEWPYESDTPVSDLPFLNWVSDTGESVAKQILTDWDNVSQELGSNIGLPIYRADLTSIDGTDFDWELTFKRKVQTKTSLKRFEHVFLCLGFGADASKFLRGTGPSYWDTEAHQEYYKLDGSTLRGQGLPGSDTELHVFGNGDGGINECLQFIFKDYLPGDPRPNLLSFLRATRANEDLKTIEKEADHRLKVIASVEDLTERRKQEKELGEETWWRYVELFQFLQDLPKYGECFGRDNRHRLGRARLFGRSPTPFDINATAINRAMLCFSVLSKSVEYYRLDRATERTSARGPHTLECATSRNGWTRKQRLKREVIQIAGNGFRAARFGPDDIYEGITINGDRIDTSENRRNFIRLTEPSAKRSREDMEAVLERFDSMYASRTLGQTYNDAFNDILSKRFKAGFQKLNLRPPESSDPTGPIYVLDYRFAGAIKTSERADWKAALPTKIFGRRVDHNDLDNPMERIEEVD